MFKKNINFKIAVIILVAIAIGAALLIRIESSSTEEGITIFFENLIKENENSKVVSEEKITYILNKGDENTISYQISLSENSTVFSLLEKLAEDEIFVIETTTYPEMGVMVESIDGYKNGTDNKYWQYWVNEELPMVAADKKNVSKGDKIEWKFEAISF